MTGDRPLSRPLRLVTMNEEMAGAVRYWAHVSMRRRRVGSGEGLEGTLLLRTGGRWDSIVAVAETDGMQLTPLLLLKNPVPLWQKPRTLGDGHIDSSTWSRLRRDLLIHNPGLGGFLELLDEAVGASL